MNKWSICVAFKVSPKLTISILCANRSSESIRFNQKQNRWCLCGTCGVFLIFELIILTYLGLVELHSRGHNCGIHMRIQVSFLWIQFDYQNLLFRVEISYWDPPQQLQLPKGNFWFSLRNKFRRRRRRIFIQNNTIAFGFIFKNYAIIL